MADIMKPVAFGDLMEQMLGEWEKTQTIFDVEKTLKAGEMPEVEFAGQVIESPYGVAAGPNTQLAQNIIAAYAGGARFIETKTVQTLYGEDLHIPRPCIRADDEAYNVEWSSEYAPDDAAREYIKAWFAVHVLAQEFGFGDPKKVQFNMSVGYNLAGVQEKSVDKFLNDLTDASQHPEFLACKAWLKENVGRFQNVDEAFIDAIPARVCNTVTLSTMHGCPADEIEAIMDYLLREKKLNAMLKLNPTLLGYDTVRSALDELGYDYIQLRHGSFDNDLQVGQAREMVARLRETAKEVGVFFGAKLSNTLEVINDKELPGDAAYMSGKALYPLTVRLAQLWSEETEGDLRLSFCGGANKDNIKDLFEAGLFPITVCTVLLRAPGYNALASMGNALKGAAVSEKVNTEALNAIVSGMGDDTKNHKSAAASKKRNPLADFMPARDKESIQCRVLCKSCVRVCPNRANTVLHTEEGDFILHIDRACNECGNCHFHCVQPCAPYRDRWTFFEDEAAFEDSENNGYVKLGEDYRYRLFGEDKKGTIDALPTQVASLIRAQEEQKPWLTTK